MMGLRNGRVVSRAGGSRASWVRVRRARRKMYAAANPLRIVMRIGYISVGIHGFSANESHPFKDTKLSS